MEDSPRLNRRAFLSGLLAAAAVPAIVQVMPSPAQWVFQGSDDGVVFHDISSRIAEYWSRRVQENFMISLENILPSRELLGA